MIAAIAALAPGDDVVEFCQRCRPGEFVLAHAASTGSSRAIIALEQAFAITFAAVCRRFAGNGHTEDDLRQILRDKLLVVVPGERATLAGYNGQGSLETWLRVTATRTFIDLGRRKDRAREVLAGDSLSGAIDPSNLALDLFKVEYRAAVSAALHDAAAKLAPSDRHLLRQHLVGGLTIDQLAAVLGIHRATAARRIARAREMLAAHVRDSLASSLGLDDHELGEVYGLVVSKFDVSFRTLLATLPTP